MRRLVTTFFFADEAANASDPVFNAIADPRVRERLLLRRAVLAGSPAGAIGYTIDIVLQGEDETPFWAD